MLAQGSAAAPRAQEVARARALDAYAAMQHAFYEPGTKSYAGVYPPRVRAQAWPFSQALWATLDIATLPGMSGDARSDLLERARPARGEAGDARPVAGQDGAADLHARR